MGALAREVVADAGHRKNPLGGFKPSSGANAGVEILGELGEVNRIVAEKASPEDAAAMREWLLDAAQEAAKPRRRAASWASTPSASARASSRCSTASATRCRRPSSPGPRRSCSGQAPILDDRLVHKMARVADLLLVVFLVCLALTTAAQVRHNQAAGAAWPGAA